MTAPGGPTGVWWAPGRVNLIGEHTDYNDGLVLPFALTRGVRARVTRTGGELLELTSTRFPGEPVRLALADLAPGAVTGWAAYPAGVVWALREAGHRLGGASVALDADLPAGGGLASSAAVECAVALAFAELFELDLPRTELARLARQAENAFAGARTGIMDQSAALLCRAGHALLLDCRTGGFTHVPLDLAGAGLVLLVVDTGVGHRLTTAGARREGRLARALRALPGRARPARGPGLRPATADRGGAGRGGVGRGGVGRGGAGHGGGGTGYADRRAACERAAALLGVPALRDVTDLDAALRALPDPVLRRRVRHVVTENHRVEAAAGLLRAGAVGEVGALLTASHLSLRDEYEVSWPRADAAVEAAVRAGARGARMVGAGFGGSVIALVPAGRAAAVEAAVARSFADRGWPAPTVTPAVPGPAAARLAGD